jgi:predicted DCC family thiol-disulfide oxidoreductase YuxK
VRLCHRSVRLLIAEDASGRAFEYAPLGSERFHAVFPAGAELPDSIVVHTAEGRTFVRSDAVVHLMHRLGGLWRVIGVLAGIVPRALRDALYDFIARVRYRIFGRTKEACPLMPPDLRSRFRA